MWCRVQATEVTESRSRLLGAAFSKDAVTLLVDAATATLLVICRTSHLAFIVICSDSFDFFEIKRAHNWFILLYFLQNRMLDVTIII